MVGGATAIHPMARLIVKSLGLKGARDLAEIAASAGLCQNLAALRALSAEGIQRGHMSLHAKNIAIQSGAEAEEIEAVAERLIIGGKVRVDIADAILKELRNP